MLKREQKQYWDENGLLILPGFYSHAAVDAVLDLQKRLWQAPPSNVVVDDLNTGRRCYMSSLSESERKHRFKVNDLFLNYDEVRSLALDARLVPILAELLSDAPVLCNSLSFDYGSGQDLHIDSLYMTPATDNRLVATWIALEDCVPEAGPLRYVLGSHRIPIYKFSTGSAHVVDEEFPLWREHVHGHVARMGLREEIFMPKKGDLLIWHAQLLHGGSPILDPNRTRKSLVSHYYGSEDCARMGYKLVPFHGGFWWERPPQPVYDAPAASAAGENGGSAPEADGEPLYSVDIVNGRSLSEDATLYVDGESEREITLGGWAVDHRAGAAAGGVYVCVDGERDIPTVYGQERKDVAAVHNNPLFEASGFAASVPTSVLEKGPHTLTLKVLTADGKGFYSPARRIHVYVR